MIRKAYSTLVFLLVVCAGAFGQSGAIRGKILDNANKQPIPFATVIAEIMELRFQADSQILMVNIISSR